MRKWMRDRNRKRKKTSPETEQTGRIGQSKETFGDTQPLQPSYYDPAAGAESGEASRVETETQPESPSTPPVRGIATGRQPQQLKTPSAPKGVVVLAIGLPGSGKTTWFKRR